MINTKLILPSEMLRPYIHHFWKMRTDGESMSEIILPMGCMKWMFHRKNPLVVNGTKQNKFIATINGPYDYSIKVESQEEVEMLTVFFQPHMTKIIMGMPGTEITNLHIDMDDLGDIAFRQLKNELQEAKSDQQIIDIIETFVLRRVMNNEDEARIAQLGSVFQEIKKRPNVHIDQLADTACLSERQFRRVFEDYVGISPKQLLRIQRFLYAAQAMTWRGDIGYETLLNQFEFTDQSHFIKEFKSFAGITPTEYCELQERRRKSVAEKIAFGNYYHIE